MLRLLTVPATQYSHLAVLLSTPPSSGQPKDFLPKLLNYKPSIRQGFLSTAMCQALLCVREPQRREGKTIPSDAYVLVKKTAAAPALMTRTAVLEHAV